MSHRPVLVDRTVCQTPGFSRGIFRIDSSERVASHVTLNQFTSCGNRWRLDSGPVG